MNKETEENRQIAHVEEFQVIYVDIFAIKVVECNSSLLISELHNVISHLKGQCESEGENYSEDNYQTLYPRQVTKVNITVINHADSRPS